jgi:4-diphosphocytidyl-2-C-methyl-D-erythritol kinase
VRTAQAYAKINLALVVGPHRPDGKHEVVTVLQRVDLHDTIAVERADALVVDGFDEDTIVHGVLESLARAAGSEPCWRVSIEKRIPVAAGLGGGSSDAATAMTLANASLDAPLSPADLHELAGRVGVDIPFFLGLGAQLATGDGTKLERVDVPTGYSVLLVVPDGETKESTGAVYAAFDDRRGADGFAERAAAVVAAFASPATVRDLAALPPNDLASSPLARELEAAGAFRADVSGAGPTVYGLFEDHEAARHAAGLLADSGATYVVRPVEASDLA